MLAGTSVELSITYSIDLSYSLNSVNVFKDVATNEVQINFGGRSTAGV